MIRLPPGENDLHRLGETDRIAEAVLAGELNLAEANVLGAIVITLLTFFVVECVSIALAGP